MTYKRVFILLLLALALLGEIRRSDAIIWHSPACWMLGWHSSQ